MTTIYLWFYCLKISDAIFLLLLATAGFLYLKHRFQHHGFWKAAVSAVLLLWLGVVIWSTLLSRFSESAAQDAAWIPFYSYYRVFNGANRELLRTNFMNVVLFYPAGLLAASILPADWKSPKKLLLAALLFFTLSLSIELIQAYCDLGLGETDDVIHNTLGGIVGVLAYRLPERLKLKSAPLMQ